MLNRGGRAICAGGVRTGTVHKTNYARMDSEGAGSQDIGLLIRRTFVRNCTVVNADVSREGQEETQEKSATTP